MIENRQQYETTKGWVKEFETMLAGSAGEPAPTADSNRWARAAETKSVRRILEDLRAQMRDYESRRDAGPASATLDTVAPPHRGTERAAVQGT